MDWIKYFIISDRKKGIKINDLGCGIHYEIDSEKYSVAWFYEKISEDVPVDDEHDFVLIEYNDYYKTVYKYNFNRLVFIINYLNNELHGSFYEIYNNRLYTIDNFINGISNGILCRWYSNNEIAFIITQKNNKKNGITFRWDGCPLLRITYYKNNKIHGNDYRWDRDKNKIDISHYIDGQSKYDMRIETNYAMW